MSGIVYDYTQHTGPWCVDHKSTQCGHAIAELAARRDAEPLAVFLQQMKPGRGITLTVPLWTTFYMWESLTFEVRENKALGRYGELLPRGKTATYDLGVTQLLPGESANDLSRTMVQQFEDIMELDMPKKLPGCKSGSHGIRYQLKIEEIVREGGNARLMPHLYGLLGRTPPMCAFCWADAYGSDARRVSADPTVAAQADDFSDMIPDESLGSGRR